MMDIGSISDLYGSNAYQTTTDKTASKISSMSEDNLKSADNEKLMDVCKEFESYFMEQMVRLIIQEMVIFSGYLERRVLHLLRRMAIQFRILREKQSRLAAIIRQQILQLPEMENYAIRMQITMPSLSEYRLVSYSSTIRQD